VRCEGVGVFFLPVRLFWEKKERGKRLVQRRMWWAASNRSCYLTLKRNKTEEEEDRETKSGMRNGVVEKK
jgi:hypothetical protein